MSSGGYDRYITIFSPEGRLYQIEYAFKAIRSMGLDCMGLRGKDCTVLVSQKKIKDKLIDPTSVTSMYQITDFVGCVMTGLIGDCKALVTQARAEAAEYRYNYGYAMPCRVLAMRMADLAQVYTQHAGRRAYAGMMILCAVDDEAGPQLYKVDPAGHFFGFKAVAAGPKYLESTTRLEKRIKEDGNEENTETTIRNVIMELQAVLSTDFKASEIEVAVVEGQNKFRTLSLEEIDEHLTAIAERD